MTDQIPFLCRLTVLVGLWAVSNLEIVALSHHEMRFGPFYLLTPWEQVLRVNVFAAVISLFGIWPAWRDTRKNGRIVVSQFAWGWVFAFLFMIVLVAGVLVLPESYEKYWSRQLSLLQTITGGCASIALLFVLQALAARLALWTIPRNSQETGQE